MDHVSCGKQRGEVLPRLVVCVRWLAASTG